MPVCITNNLVEAKTRNVTKYGGDWQARPEVGPRHIYIYIYVFKCLQLRIKLTIILFNGILPMKTDLKGQVVGIHYYGQVIIMQQHGKTMYACMYRGLHADFLIPSMIWHMEHKSLRWMLWKLCRNKTRFSIRWANDVQQQDCGSGFCR